MKNLQKSNESILQESKINIHSISEIKEYDKIINDKIKIKKEMLQEEYKKDKIIFPLDKYLPIFSSFSIMIIFIFLKGSESLQSIIGIKP